jgi:hypothetical protein
MRKRHKPEQIVRKLREADALLSGEIFYTLLEAVVLVEQWRRFVPYGSTPQCLGRSTSRSGDGKTIRLVPH